MFHILFSRFPKDPHNLFHLLWRQHPPRSRPAVLVQESEQDGIADDPLFQAPRSHFGRDIWAILPSQPPERGGTVFPFSFFIIRRPGHTHLQSIVAGRQAPTDKPFNCVRQSSSTRNKRSRFSASATPDKSPMPFRMRPSNTCSSEGRVCRTASRT